MRRDTLRDLLDTKKKQIYGKRNAWIEYQSFMI